MSLSRSQRRCALRLAEPQRQRHGHPEQQSGSDARLQPRRSAVDDDTYNAAADLLGPSGVVELAAIIGYYTMLGYAMSVAEAC